ncbi:MAG: hypothetical protein JRD89_20340, partial [Deltaproteobacteria bacterium]|nr:hypothetical protein [Deltaproteobacteria bacterium]
MDKVKLDWDSMWNAMARSAADYMARIVTETALNTAAKGAAAGMDWLGEAMGWWAAGAWEIKKEHMAMLHPGEMVVPKSAADMIRGSQGGGGNAGLGDAWDGAMSGNLSASGAAIMAAFAQGTMGQYGKKTTVNMFGFMQGNTFGDFMANQMSPTAIAGSALFGGIPAGLTEAFGLDEKGAKLGYRGGAMLAALAGLNPALGIVAGLLGIAAVETAIDALNVRAYEELHDAMEGALGNIGGRQEFA